MLEATNTTLFEIYFRQTLLIISIILWIVCLIDIFKNKFKKNYQLIWSLTVIFLPISGAILYLFYRKKTF